MFSSSYSKQTKNKLWARWKLFHATDFLSLMYINFLFCRILGIFPYKINASTFETSTQRYILSTVLILVVCAGELTFLYEIVVDDDIINFMGVTNNLEYISYLTFSGSIALITYVLSRPRMRVLQSMLKISSRLPRESYQKLSRWIHLKDVLGSLFLITQSCVFIEDEDNFIGIILIIYIDLVVFQMNMQYVNCVCVLKACFKEINDDLVHMQKILVNNKPYAPTLICHTQKDQFLLIELKEMKKQHLIISNTVQMLNVIFSLQLLSTIALTFTNIIFELYSHLLRWKGGLSIILDEDNLEIVFFIVSVAYELVMLTLIAWVCETGKKQACEISMTVHDVLNHTADEQIKEELQIFSFQILHCGNVFSTKGLSVDATLLTAMAGSITTYILILAQFMIMSHSCDGKAANNITQMTLLGDTK